MSTKRDTKYAAKRRAAARKRTRDIGRYIFAYFVIAILVIGTISSVFIAQVGTSTPTVTATATPPAANGLGQLVTQGDTSIATGDFATGISYYNAYLAQDAQNADVHFKLGKAYLDANNPSPDYVSGLDHLQRAININPTGSFVDEARSLISQYGTAANATINAMPLPTSPISGTVTVTGTQPASNTAIVPTVPVTATTPITP